jgi:hypothetical protein
MSVWSLNDIANHDRAILPDLQAPCGSAFMRGAGLSVGCRRSTWQSARIGRKVFMQDEHDRIIDLELSSAKGVVQHHIHAVHAGTAYGPGEVADLPQHIAYQWLGSGWAVKDAD